MGLVRVIEGAPLTGTTRIAVPGDKAIVIPESVLVHGSDRAHGVQITVEVAAIRAALGGVVPTNDEDAVGDLLESGDVYQLNIGWSSLRQMQLIAADPAKTAAVQVTALF